MTLEPLDFSVQFWKHFIGVNTEQESYLWKAPPTTSGMLYIADHTTNFHPTPLQKLNDVLCLSALQAATYQADEHGPTDLQAQPTYTNQAVFSAGFLVAPCWQTSGTWDIGRPRRYFCMAGVSLPPRARYRSGGAQGSGESNSPSLQRGAQHVFCRELGKQLLPTPNLWLRHGT